MIRSLSTQGRAVRGLVARQQDASPVEKRVQSSDFAAMSLELGPQRERELFGSMERSWKLGVQGYIGPFLQSSLGRGRSV